MRSSRHSPRCSSFAPATPAAPARRRRRWTKLVPLILAGGTAALPAYAAHTDDELEFRNKSRNRLEQQSSVNPRTCQDLTLYGNAVNTGLCKKISTGTHWVCELTQDNPDVHTTFNADTALHVTVKFLSNQGNACEERAYLTGNWPGGLTFAPGQSPVRCGINVRDYIDRLNAVPALPADGGSTACQTAFNAALNAGKISFAEHGFYKSLCMKMGPRGSSCP